MLSHMCIRQGTENIRFESCWQRAVLTDCGYPSGQSTSRVRRPRVHLGNNIKHTGDVTDRCVVIVHDHDLQAVDKRLNMKQIAHLFVMRPELNTVLGTNVIRMALERVRSELCRNCLSHHAGNIRVKIFEGVLQGWRHTPDHFTLVECRPSCVPNPWTWFEIPLCKQ